MGVSELHFTSLPDEQSFVSFSSSLVNSTRSLDTTVPVLAITYSCQFCHSERSDLCPPGIKYSQLITCDTMSSARGSGGERVNRLVVSPVQLEPSHTLLETHNPKPVRVCVIGPRAFQSSSIPACTCVMCPLLLAGVQWWPTAPCKHSDLPAQSVRLSCILTGPHYGLAAQRHEPGRVLASHR